MVQRTTRPVVPLTHPSEVEHRRLLAIRASASLPKDGTEGMSAPLGLSKYLTGVLPDPTLTKGAIVYDNTLGLPAVSDGAAWNPLATAGSVSTVAANLAALTALTTPVPWTIITKTADEARASNTTLTDDAVLKFPVLASTKYRFRGMAFISVASATPGVKYDINGPASPTLVRYVFRSGSDTSSSLFDERQSTVFGTQDDYATAVEINVWFDGILQNGSNAGNVAFRWAQFTSNAALTTVRAGSYIEFATV